MSVSVKQIERYLHTNRGPRLSYSDGPSYDRGSETPIVGIFIEGLKRDTSVSIVNLGDASRGYSSVQPEEAFYLYGPYLGGFYFNGNIYVGVEEIRIRTTYLGTDKRILTASHPIKYEDFSSGRSSYSLGTSWSAIKSQTYT